MGTVTLKDGREVDSASEEWRMECLERHNARRIADAPEIARHVENLWTRPDRRARAEYVEELARKDAWMCAAVKCEFEKRWEAAQAARRRAAQRASAEGVA